MKLYVIQEFACALCINEWERALAVQNAAFKKKLWHHKVNKLELCYLAICSVVYICILLMRHISSRWARHCLWISCYYPFWLGCFFFIAKPFFIDISLGRPFVSLRLFAHTLTLSFRSIRFSVEQTSCSKLYLYITLLHFSVCMWICVYAIPLHIDHVIFFSLFLCTLSRARARILLYHSRRRDEENCICNAIIMCWYFGRV